MVYYQILEGNISKVKLIASKVILLASKIHISALIDQDGNAGHAAEKYVGGAQQNARS